MTSVCDYEACNKPLLTRDTIISNISQSVRWNLLEWLQKVSYNEIQQRKSKGQKFGITIPIKGVPVGFNLDENFSDEDFKKLQEYIKSGRVEYFSDEMLDTFVSHMFNEEAYKAWSTCMQNMINTCGTGLQLMQVKYDGNDTIIRIRYVPEKMGDPYPIVKEDLFVPQNAKCQAGCLKKGDELTDEHLVLITRNNDEQGTIILLTDRGDIQVSLKKEEEAPPPTPQPTPQPPQPPPTPPILISEGEKQEAMRMLYRFIFDKYHEQYDNLGPGGIIKVEEFNTDGSKVQLKILFHYVRECIRFDGRPSRTRRAIDSYMEGTIDLADLDSLENTDASVTIQIPACLGFPHRPREERTLYIPWRRIAEEILSVVHKT